MTLYQVIPNHWSQDTFPEPLETNLQIKGSCLPPIKLQEQEAESESGGHTYTYLPFFRSPDWRLLGSISSCELLSISLHPGSALIFMPLVLITRLSSIGLTLTYRNTSSIHGKCFPSGEKSAFAFHEDQRHEDSGTSSAGTERKVLLMTLTTALHPCHSVGSSVCPLLALCFFFSGYYCPSFPTHCSAFLLAPG